MRDDLHLRSLGKRLTVRGMDSPSARHPEGLSPGPLTLHPSSGRLGCMHIASVLARCPVWISVGQAPRWHTLATICQQYNILHLGIHGGRSDTLVHDGHLLGFLWSSSEPGQVHLRRVWVTRGGDRWLLPDPGDAHWSPTDPVPRVAACRLPASAPGLASSVREGADALGRLAGTPLVTLGYLVMLKAVLGGIPIYYMSIFRMLVGIRRCLEKTMQSFFWRGSQSEESRGAALVSWTTMCWLVS